MTRKKETILCRPSAADLPSPTTTAAAVTKTVPTAGDIIVKYDDNDNYDDNDADDGNNFTNKRKKKD